MVGREAHWDSARYMFLVIVKGEISELRLCLI